MFDIAPTELLLVAVVALVVIGPKDLPAAMRVAGKWIGRARGVARQFRSGIDNMIRESELAELEKQWKAENERIMREHPAHSPVTSPLGSSEIAALPAPVAGESGGGADGEPPVETVAPPVIHPDPAPVAAAPHPADPVVADPAAPGPHTPSTEPPHRG